jgi:hypothetical protein
MTHPIPTTWCRLHPGEIVRDGDVLVYGEGTQVTVHRCKYDPGCCVGHMVEAHEVYYRTK